MLCCLIAVAIQECKHVHIVISVFAYALQAYEQSMKKIPGHTVSSSTRNQPPGLITVN